MGLLALKGYVHRKYSFTRMRCVYSNLLREDLSGNNGGNIILQKSVINDHDSDVGGGDDDEGEDRNFRFRYIDMFDGLDFNLIDDEMAISGISE